MSLTQFTSITGTCVPVPGPDMDTDRIIPARFLKCITFDELAGVMFWDERFDENGQSKSHPVDDPRFKGASIILGGSNFGCGSSCEHAPIAILGAGMPVVIGHSFARIFYRNAFNMGLLLMEVGDEVDKINDGDALEIDAATGRIRDLSNGAEITCPPLPQSMAAILSKGGLVGYVKERLARG